MNIEKDNSKIKEYRDREETLGLLHLKAKSIKIRIMLILKSLSGGLERRLILKLNNRVRR